VREKNEFLFRVYFFRFRKRKEEGKEEEKKKKTPHRSQLLFPRLRVRGDQDELYARVGGVAVRLIRFVEGEGGKRES